MVKICVRRGCQQKSEKRVKASNCTFFSPLCVFSTRSSRPSSAALQAMRTLAARVGESVERSSAG